ncbi:MAG: hypothetical protein K1X78_10765 [Verrucomicrobiaceae bacterium]|nr:hypothetical protein [Verrucomicrobiaceae bacterium]
MSVAFCFMLLLAAQHCHADTPLEVTLVSEVTSIQPGRPFYAGLHLHHGPAYHSYWKYPGIVGVPTGVTWKLPRGFEAGEIEWPEPEPVLMFKIKAQGFERDVVLPVKITPPANLKPGEVVKLEGKASWMSCARTCHPGFTDISLSLPVSNDAPAFDEKWRPAFEKERSLAARPSDAWQTAATESGMTVVLTVTPVRSGARKFTADQTQKIIFFTEDGWIDSDKPQVIRLNADGSIAITLTRSDIYLGKEPPRTLAGLLQSRDGWLNDGKLASLSISPTIGR